MDVSMIGIMGILMLPQCSCPYLHVWVEACGQQHEVKKFLAVVLEVLLWGWALALDRILLHMSWNRYPQNNTPLHTLVFRHQRNSSPCLACQS